MKWPGFFKLRPGKYPKPAGGPGAFLENRQIDELANQALLRASQKPELSLEFLEDLFPFMSSPGLSQLVQTLMEESNPDWDLLESAHPFLSQADFDGLIQEMVARGQKPEVPAALMNFLSEEQMTHLASLYANGSGFVSAAPFLSQDRLDALVVQSLK